MLRKFICEVISVLFIILWMPAAMSKFMGYETFKFQLGRSPYLESMAGLVAIAVPIVEIVIVLLLVSRRTRLLGLYASFFLMLLFTGYIYVMLNFSYFTSCSCGGILKLFGLEDDWNSHLMFNVIFTLFGLVAILIWKKGKSESDFQQLKPTVQ